MKNIISILLLLVSMPIYAEPVIVASAELNKKEAIAIFKLDSFIFPNGDRVKMVLPPRESFVAKEFLFTLGYTPSRWYERVEDAFATGRLNKLRIVDSEKTVSDEVQANKGSIGYAQHYYIYSVPATIINIRE